MPAASQVRIGVLFAVIEARRTAVVELLAVRSATFVAVSTLAAIGSGLGPDDPPPQPTRAAAPSSEAR